MPEPLTRFIPNRTPCGRTRREFLWQVGGGFAGLALIDVLSRSGFFETHVLAAPTLDPAHPLAPKKPHFPAKAKHVVFLFMNGGPSQVDTFDPKPVLLQRQGEVMTGVGTVVPSQGTPGGMMPSPWSFKKYGQCGLDVSELRVEV
jgi:hypothetical protein